ncbi:hypothetical protein DL768_002186 [Monosporascus sp. mg162]|nr:hypothetical protein DL768_002186 [Monosporascus sp. mg162]
MLDTSLLLYIHCIIKFVPNSPLAQIEAQYKRHMSFSKELGVNKSFSGRFLLARFPPDMRRNWRMSDRPNVGCRPKPSPSSPAPLEPAMTLTRLLMRRQIFAEATAEDITQ